MKNDEIVTLSIPGSTKEIGFKIPAPKLSDGYTQAEIDAYLIGREAKAASGKGFVGDY